ncbi:MAG: ATP-binding cassette domain-containing protein, partial [Lachnospiraceae bacterium]|nr:ATP-binding cassette domain-containing protein [Lachnospiraceae bacterium]
SNAYPSQLSGGQKQRVAIARALATDPKVLLCDEATSALDPQTTHSILKLLKQLNQKLGITIVIITHEMAVIKEICSRVAVMENGRVAEEGEVFEVFADPKEEITKNFINTTSVLQKAYELIRNNSPVVELNREEKLLKLQYLEKSVSEALLSGVSRKFEVDCNIIFANIEMIGEAPLGGTVVIMSGTAQAVEQAIGYLAERNILVEVLKDGNAA